MSAHDDELASLRDIPDPLGGSDELSRPAPAPAPAALGSAPTRGDARRRRWLAGLVTSAWLVLVAVALGLRGDLGDGALRTMVQIVLPAAAGAVVLWTAITSGPAGLGTRTGRLIAAFAAAATAFAASALLGSGVLLDDRPGVGRAMAVCFAHVMVIGGVPLITLAFGLRRAFPANAPWRSVLVAAAAGLFGAAALGMHCSTQCGMHMLVGHALPAVTLAFVGGALLARVTRA